MIIVVLLIWQFAAKLGHNLFEKLVLQFILLGLRAFATLSRKNVLTYRFCLNLQYSFIGINLKRRCENNDRSPPLFFQKIFAKYIVFSWKSGYFFKSMKSIRKLKSISKTAFITSYHFKHAIELDKISNSGKLSDLIKL